MGQVNKAGEEDPSTRKAKLSSCAENQLWLDLARGSLVFSGAGFVCSPSAEGEEENFWLCDGVTSGQDKTEGLNTHHQRLQTR